MCANTKRGERGVRLVSHQEVERKRRVIGLTHLCKRAKRVVIAVGVPEKEKTRKKRVFLFQLSLPLRASEVAFGSEVTA